MNMIQIEGIEKTYFNGKIDVPALKGINLNIDKGDFVVLAGPSGSGKTTLLNIIGAMDNPTKGAIKIDNEEISKLTGNQASKFRRDKIGFIFQSFNLIPVLTAYENIEFSLDLLKKYSNKEKKERVEKILKQVGIYELRNRKPKEMSGGQQQRVAVARALVKEPSILLADEPTANLDTETGESILDVMKQLNEELNITFVFSSHDPKIIERARRVIRLRDGLVQDDLNDVSLKTGEFYDNSNGV